MRYTRNSTSIQYCSRTHQHTYPPINFTIDISIVIQIVIEFRFALYEASWGLAPCLWACIGNYIHYKV